VRIAGSVEAARGRPRRTSRRLFQPWDLNVPGSVAGVSLPNCAGDHLGNEEQEDKKRRAPTEASQNGSGRFIHPSYTAEWHGYRNDVKVTWLLLREPSERVTLPATDLRCRVGQVIPWLKVVSINHLNARLRPGNLFLLFSNFFAAGLELCGKRCACPTIASLPRGTGKSAELIGEHFRILMGPNSTIGNNRSQIRWDLAGREVACTPLPAAQQRRARSAPYHVVNDYGRGRGLGRARGVGVTLGAGVGVAVGGTVVVGVGVGVGARGTIA